MKILTITLPFMTSFFINLCEGSTPERIRKPALVGKPQSDPHPRTELPAEPTTTIRYLPEPKKVKISMWLDATRTIVLKAVLENDQYEPTGQYKVTHTVKTFLDVRQGLRFVVFQEDDGRILGVRAPHSRARVGRSRALILEPNEATWFISYSGKNFKVKQDPLTKILISVSLIPKNLELIYVNDDYESYQITLFGVHLWVHTNLSDCGKIVGVNIAM